MRTLTTLAVLVLATDSAFGQSLLHEIVGGTAGDRTGWSIAGAGDVNADGFDDFVVGHPGLGNRGRVDIHSGLDGSLLWSVNGAALGNKLGWSVDGAGDVNGDGFDDVIAGAEGVRAIVISGATGVLLYDVPGTIDFGFSVAGLGDLNGDGFDDFGVGAPREILTTNDKGVARAYSGVDGSVMYTWDGLNLGNRFGSDVASAGDINNDGRPDVIVGLAATSGPRYVRVFSGMDGSLLHHVDGIGAFGGAVNGAGDLNSDGQDDFMVGDVGASPHGPNSGEVRIFSGLDASLLMVLSGSDSFEQFGSSLSPIGDVNGDLVNDLLVGADRHSWFGNDKAGAAFLFSGADGSLLHRVRGPAGSSLMGFACASVGDTNGDGVLDYAVGAPDHSPGVTNGGSIQVLSSGCLGTDAESYCTSLPNSTGAAATVGYAGSASLSSQDLFLSAQGVPPGNFGLFFWGPYTNDATFGDGRLCVGGTVIRINPPVQAGPTGSALIGVDYSILSSSLSVGDRPKFQFWYRDPGGPGGSGFNTGDGLQLTICP